MREERYIRNLIFSDSEQELLSKKKVAILGLGGLGGYVLEELARIGIGNILACDFDVFSSSNLNRQILSTVDNLEKMKADEAVIRASKINPLVSVKAYTKKGEREELKKELKSCDLVFDCLDTSKDRLALSEICNELGIALVHGAVDGWFGQVSTIFPGDKTMEKVYSSEPKSEDGNVAFTCGVISSLEVSEGIKVLLNREETLRNKLLLVNLMDNEFKTIEL